MASKPPPVLTRMILCGPEIVLVHGVLVAALERAGLNMDADPLVAADAAGPLAGVHARWARHVRNLDSGGFGLAVDGIGLRELTVPLSDILVLLLVLQGHLVDLTAVSGEEDDPGYDELHVEAVLKMIIRLEGLL